jgi:hypothetical protein
VPQPRHVSKGSDTDIDGSSLRSGQGPSGYTQRLALVSGGTQALAASLQTIL